MISAETIPGMGEEGVKGMYSTMIYLTQKYHIFILPIPLEKILFLL
jgi:hypothetical protein